MKKKLVLTLVSVIFACFVYSQENESFRLMRLGISGIGGIGWIKSDEPSYDSRGIRLVYGYGLDLEMRLFENIGVATGIGTYYGGGALENVDTLSNKHNVMYRLQYLEVPLTLKMKTNEIGYITYFAEFGGGFDLRLRAFADSTTKDLNGTPLPTRNNINVKSQIHIYRVAFMIGGGIEYSLWGTTRLLAAVYFNNGLTDIFKLNQIKGRNNNLNLKLGIIF